jgi:hypothetical protein
VEGLIVLGAAWESPDMFDALSTLWPPWRSNMRSLASLRALELRSPGLKSTDANPPADIPDASADAGPPPWSIDSNYVRLRTEADAWQARRTAYMMERLTAGRHPDTDPTFWADWTDPGPPKLIDKPWYERPVVLDGVAVLILFGLPALLLLGGIALAIRHWRRDGFRLDEALMTLAVAVGGIIVWAAAVFPMMAKTR